ncbi:MAG: peptide MFS transporter [Acidobacteriota bacterium]|nr:peptide MFS transporter [Acidobacteriota bacterium]MDQ7086601.1 peptide MFS transporter [Acidobacteriota bacterium]
MPPSAGATVEKREFLGHPVGLYVLFFTEMWERFSYYGMRAILILYMVQYLAWSDSRAGGIYGDYTGLVYITPLLGGFLADRYLGMRRAILIGALIMAAGQGMLAFHAWPSAAGGSGAGVAPLYLGLLLLIAGNGFFKPNISTLVGQLYEPGDARRDAAFTIFYMGINIGAFLAPLVCGTLAQSENFGWHWGFGAACLGMFLGFLIFAWGQRFLGDRGHAPAPIQQREATSTSSESLPPMGMAEKMRLAWIGVVGAAVTLGFAYWSWNGSHSAVDAVRAMIWPGTVFVVIGMYVFMLGRCTRDEIGRVSVIFALGTFVMIFWAAYEQAGSSLTLFAERATRLEIFGFSFVSSNFQALPALLVILFAPVFSALWTALALKGKDPSTPVKMALGLLFNAAGFLVMVQAALLAADGQRVSPLWLSACYLLQVMGELCLSPIGLSMVTRLAPARYGAMLMGVWFLANAFAGKLAGLAGSLYESLETPTLFGGTAGILIGFGLLLLLCAPWLKRKMAS